jgi:hypothetical protein
MTDDADAAPPAGRHGDGRRPRRASDRKLDGVPEPGPRSLVGDESTDAGAPRTLVPIAEFGSLFEAEAAAAFARTGGRRVYVHRIDALSTRLGAGSNWGRFALMASTADAIAVRQALLDNGVDASSLEGPASGLPWRQAIVAFGVLLGFTAIVILAGALNHRL